MRAAGLRRPMPARSNESEILRAQRGRRLAPSWHSERRATSRGPAGAGPRKERAERRKETRKLTSGDGNTIFQPMSTSPRILSVNVSGVRTVNWRGRSITTGIFKEPVDHAVDLFEAKVAGDEQADLTVHGGVDKAVYAYAAEDYAWWGEQIGRRLAPGMFGENLTTEGVAASVAVIGERWRVGTAVVEVSQPRMPCYKLGMKMDDPEFVRAFAAGRRPGAYLRVIERGRVGPGDAAEILSKPAHGVTVRDVAEIYTFDRARAPELRDLPGLAATMRAWARADHSKDEPDDLADDAA